MYGNIEVKYIIKNKKNNWILMDNLEKKYFLNFIKEKINKK